MIFLSGTTQSLLALSDGAASTEEPAFVVGYTDTTDETFVGASAVGSLNGTTKVQIAPPPPSAVTRAIKSINICNRDTDTHAITVIFKNDILEFTLFTGTVGAGETLLFTPEVGWVIGGRVGPPGPGVPSGGTTGQVLAKKSDDDFDTEWVTP